MHDMERDQCKWRVMHGTWDFRFPQLFDFHYKRRGQKARTFASSSLLNGTLALAGTDGCRVTQPDIAPVLLGSSCGSFS